MYVLEGFLLLLQDPENLDLAGPLDAIQALGEFTGLEALYEGIRSHAVLGFEGV
jgi:hypothetical protein